MITACDCYLLDENSGEFVADGIRVAKYHNARFYDLENTRNEYLVVCPIPIMEPLGFLSNSKPMRRRLALSPG